MNISIELNNELSTYPTYLVLIAHHLLLAYPIQRLLELCSLLILQAGPQTNFFPQQVQFPHRSNEITNEVNIWTTCSIHEIKLAWSLQPTPVHELE